MNIGIDIDGVLTNDDDYILACTSKFCFENNMEGIVEPYKYEYDKLNWNEEILNNYRSKYYDEYLHNEPIRKFASEVIEKLKEDGHNIYIITARYKTCDNTEDSEIMREKTRNWLIQNKIKYDKLIFENVPKIKALKENNIDLMIEDSPITIQAIKNVVKNIFCFDTRYNQEIKFDNLTRVFSWYDIYREIKNI